MITDTASAITALNSAGASVQTVALGVGGAAVLVAALLFAIPFGWRYFRRILGR